MIKVMLFTLGFNQFKTSLLMVTFFNNNTYNNILWNRDSPVKKKRIQLRKPTLIRYFF